MKHLVVTVLTAGALALGAVGIWLVVDGNGPASAGDPPPFHGQGRQFTLLEPVEPAPLQPIATGSGGVTNLKDYRGKVVLLNFWASWCAPCLEELPSLDALEQDMGGPDFAVLPLNIDRGGREVARPFLDRAGVETLGLFTDPQRTNFYAFGMSNHPMPTTFLIDREGRLIGYLEGPAEWDSDEAKALIRYYIDRDGAS